MKIKYPKKNIYGTGDKRGEVIGLKEIKMTAEQKQWYEIGFMCGYADGLKSEELKRKNN